MSHQSNKRAHDNEKTHNRSHQTFGKWAWSQLPLVITQIVGLLALVSPFVYYLVEGSAAISHIVTIPLLKKVILYANLGFVTFCIFKVVYILNDNDHGELRAKEVYERIFNTDVKDDAVHKWRRRKSKEMLRRFKVYFLLFWIGMALLYVALSLNDASDAKADQSTQPVAASETPGHTTSLHTTAATQPHSKPDWLHVLGEERSTGSVNVAVTPNQPEDTAKLTPQDPLHTTVQKTAASFIKFKLASYCLNILTTLFIFWCFSVLSYTSRHLVSRKKQFWKINLSSFVAALLLLLLVLCMPFSRDGEGYYTAKGLADYMAFFDAVAGVLSALVLALVIARLDSKLIGLPSWLVGVLYLYAAVQPLLVVQYQPGTVNKLIDVSVYFMMFSLKIYFFLIIVYVAQTGRLLTYLYCFPTLDSRVDSLLQNEYRIVVSCERTSTGHRYNYSVYRDNELEYFSDRHFATRKECLNAVEHLRTAASNPKNFKIIETRNSRWLGLLENANKVLCVSRREVLSMEEAEEMRDEVLEKIPFSNVSFEDEH